jgi:hypothetical protein
MTLDDHEHELASVNRYAHAHFAQSQPQHQSAGIPKMKTVH